jgi:hypothetical protein
MSASQSSAAAVLDRAPTAEREPRNVLLPYELGDLSLANRMVVAPMTRSRAVEGNVPNPLAATYYLQRASAGLIVTEATQVSPQGVGYIRTPGIHSRAGRGWRRTRQHGLAENLPRRGHGGFSNPISNARAVGGAPVTANERHGVHRRIKADGDAGALNSAASARNSRAS